MEHRPELSEKDQNRLALEKFENRLLDKGKPKPQNSETSEPSRKTKEWFLSFQSSLKYRTIQPCPSLNCKNKSRPLISMLSLTNGTFLTSTEK